MLSVNIWQKDVKIYVVYFWKKKHLGSDYRMNDQRFIGILSYKKTIFDEENEWTEH